MPKTNRSSTKKKRYNLVLPEELFDELNAIADRDGINLVDVFRRFSKLGLYLDHVRSENPNASIIIRDGNVETRVEVIM